MARPKPCFPNTDIQLPKFLNFAPRGKERGIFEYKKKDGKKITLKQGNQFETIEELLDICRFLDAQRDESYREANKNREKGQKPDKCMSEIEALVEKYIAHVEEKDVTKASGEGWYGQTLGLRKYIGRSNLSLVSEINRGNLYKLWNAMDYYPQRNHNSEFQSFFTWLKDTEVLPETFQNPFVPKSAGGFKRHPVPPKLRPMLSKEDFSKILIVAEDKGYHFVRDAMEIGLGTGLRIGDILRLTHSKNIVDGKLITNIKKSETRSVSLPQANSYDLTSEIQKRTMEAVKRAWLRSPTDCDHLIHHVFRCDYKSKKKEHPNQVTKRYFNSAFRECVKELDAWKDKQHVPTFHEIRALCFGQLFDAGIPIDQISIFLGHSDIKITLSAYATHKERQVQQIEFAAQL